MSDSTYTTIGVVGAGAMGSGIAQVAAQAKTRVILYDLQEDALNRASEQLQKILNRLEEKERISSAKEVFERIEFINTLDAFKEANLVIEAIIENLEVKQKVFQSLEKVVAQDCILASNTSSLSITSIAAACKHPERVLGIHFFNPAPLMALVEVIPAIQTRQGLGESMVALMKSWGKAPVLVKDTPGFIVNRVARPFYSEALRIYEEGLATKEFIDAALTQVGGFRMGPFTLMDYIGHDVNYVVTETVFQSFYQDPRYTPSLTQKRLLEAGWLGRKSGKGFFDYSEAFQLPTLDLSDEEVIKKAEEIVHRVVCMLINEAVDALYLGIANKEDLETAMTRGVNYPKGLLAWCNEWGSDFVLAKLDVLNQIYKEDRYRPSTMLREYGLLNKKF
ncbi:MAG TPA: 3-hydroxyacyl-CoA dehydrogenase NAD-binding domain-containing protein [Chitinophagaceae bacterium]|nr:3-hydroxyacyl-CoA dehydrogenase NAD-binding domain-containing protein [Chitinophagaceae bacterium]